ncbi:MAG: hypothetical protein AAB545_02370 [Patescibacteria group bacterium]
MEISLEDFKKCDMRAGKILSAEKILDADRLLKLSVDFGPKSSDSLDGSVEEKREVRQIISGIAEFFPDPETLVGRTVAFITNIPKRTIRGLESQGMILALKSENAFSLLSIDEDIPPGAIVG